MSKIFFRPKEDFQQDDAYFYKKFEYTGIILDAWPDQKDKNKDIFGFEITGGTLLRKIVAFTRGDFESKCIINEIK